MANRFPRRLAYGSIALAALAAGLATAADVAAADNHDPVSGGPSVLASYLSGGSPYTGVGRYEGRATCTAFFVDTGPFPFARDADAPAYALTSGHCPALPGPNDVLVDSAGVGRVVFNFFIDSQHWQIPVPVARTAYATVKGQNVAVLELDASYRELVGRLIRPWPVAAQAGSIVGETIDIAGAPLWLDLAESFLRITHCRIEGVAPVVLEHVWHWFDAPFNRCRDIFPGSTGSPVISTIGRHVIGMVNTTTLLAPPLTECALNHPCEPVNGGSRSRPDTTYVTSLAGIMNCFDLHRRFNVHEIGCALDPGIQPAATLVHIGPVNPLLRTQPLGTVRRTWNVTVDRMQEYYQYATVVPPFDDCRTTRAYSEAIRTAAVPSIDMPLPVSEGFAFLCILGTGIPEGTDGRADAGEHPTIVVARTDLTPPRLPAQITIVDTDGAWRVRFSTVGHEVAFHVYKVGPPDETRCDDPAGYQLAVATVIGLPKATHPYLLCAIPYDAAQNPGALLERLLP